jgi:hypothetical protein
MLPALTALREGYTVYVVTDTCGFWTPAIEQAAWQRLSQAGAILTNMQALVAELQNNLMLADPAAAKARQRDMIAFFGTYVGPTALMNATFMPKLAAPTKQFSTPQRPKQSIRLLPCPRNSPNSSRPPTAISPSSTTSRR